METSGLSDRLSHYGIHVDDLSRLRVLDENSGAHSHDLRDNCREFVGDVSNLTDIADGFIEVIDAVANEVNKQKALKCLGPLIFGSNDFFTQNFLDQKFFWTKNFWT